MEKGVTMPRAKEVTKDEIKFNVDTNP